MNASQYRRIEDLLTDRGWSQAELARQIGVDSSLVNHWLAKRRYPSLSMAGRLVDLGMDLKALLPKGR